MIVVIRMCNLTTTSKTLPPIVLCAFDLADAETGTRGDLDGEQRSGSAEEEAQGDEEEVTLAEAIEEMSAEAEQNQAWSLEHGLTLIGLRKKATPARRRRAHPCCDRCMYMSLMRVYTFPAREAGLLH